jgi:hypothetical protein
VLDNDSMDISSMIDEYSKGNNNDGCFDISQSMFRLLE